MATISPSNPSIDIGATLQLSVSGGTVSSWESKNRAVATVDRTTGVVTGNGAGQCTITAHLSEGGTATTTLYVASLLVYAADGNFYLIPASTWAATPPLDSGRISSDITNELTDQGSNVPNIDLESPQSSFVSCYVLGLAVYSKS